MRMKPNKAVSIEDLRAMARRRLPSFIFDMIEGGIEDEHGVERNVSAFRDLLLYHRVLNDVEQRSQETTLFGVSYASPFGISATGPAPIYRRGADGMLASVARKRNIPYILSGTSGSSLESIAALAGHNAWYQLYAARDRSISEDLIRRAGDAGIETLVFTVDTPVTPKRERHRRNGVTSPIKFTPSIAGRLLLEAVRHPGWFYDYVTGGGMPLLENWQKYAPAGSTSMQVADFFRTQFPSVNTWKDLERFRSVWKGNFVVKGISHPDDARRAVDIGINGITVSNHGGKVLDRALAPIQALPAIKAAVGNRAVVMMDGGIRRGSDIAVAKCLGADFVFTGRATLWGVSAAGEAGADRAVAILREELDLVLATIGCADFSAIDETYLFDPAARTQSDLPAARGTTGDDELGGLPQRPGRSNRAGVR